MKFLSFLLISLCLFPLTQNSWADVSPSMSDIFAFNGIKGLIKCSSVQADNYYCENPVKTFDSEGKPGPLKMISKITTTGGEGIWFSAVDNIKTINATECLFQIRFEDKAPSFIKAPCSELVSMEKALTELIDSYEVTTYDFNPLLKEVSLTKDKSSPLPVKDVLKLTEDPNKRIGTLEISGTTKDMTFSYPGKGEKKWSTQDLLKLKEKMPVFRKNGDKYLVELPYTESEGVASDAPIESKLYSWIDTSGSSVKFSSDTSPLESPSLKYHMERGATFLKGQTSWTSFKIYALFLDFDATTQNEEGFIKKKKVFLREVFLPVFDSQNHINFWLHWEPGC
jgi:hypothetical protein